MTAAATDGSTGPTTSTDPAGPRSVLRAVALPTEHGGWALTLEPAALGLLVAVSGAGWCLAAAALVAFVARTPIKVVLVDRWRHRSLPRTAVAARVAAAELAVLVALVAGAVRLAAAPFWWPAVAAAPLVAVELWFDMRSRSRRLVPELTGAAGMGAVATMIALAGGAAPRLALALWLVLAARVISSIPFVRSQIQRVHGDARGGHGWVPDVVALTVVAVAVAVAPAVLGGAAALVLLVAAQRIADRRPVPRVALVGVQQLVAGVGVVVLTAVGVWRA